MRLEWGEGKDLADERLGTRLKDFSGVGTNGTEQLFHIGLAPLVLYHDRGAVMPGHRSRKSWRRLVASAPNGLWFTF